MAMNPGADPIGPDQFTEQAQQVLAASQQYVRQFQHNQWDVEHLGLALVEQQEGLTGKVFEELGVDAAGVGNAFRRVLESYPKVAYQAAQIYATPRIQRVLEMAREEAQRFRDEYISSEHILIAIAGEGTGESSRIMSENGITKESVYQALQKVRGGHRVTDQHAESKYRSLQKYSHDLTEMARHGKLD
ncbi:MAG: Clp protease N-terminal domain-containing protein, partial [Chloroflexota bacterium]